MDGKSLGESWFLKSAFLFDFFEKNFKIYKK